MKRISFIIMCFFIIAWLLQGCEKELMDYQGKPGVYFAVQHGFTGGNDAIWPYQPKSNVEFFKILGDTTTVEIKVMATGSVSEEDRLFRMEINPDSTNATPGVHYESLSGNYFIPAGKAYALIPITLYRTADMQVKDITVGLRLLPNDNFELAFPEWHAVDDLYYGDVVESFDDSQHTLVINDVMTRPSQWSGQASSSGLEGGLFGEFSRKKLELMCELCDVTYEDFCDANIMITLLKYEIRNTMAKYLTNALEEGHPVLEDDGRLMWVGTCTWSSYIGVPYIPE